VDRNLELERYLDSSYRRDVMGESVKVEAPAATPELIKTVKGMIAGIDGLRLGANLANRDFVTYQHRRALERLLKQLEASRAADG
jgi:hypothetical protein